MLSPKWNIKQVCSPQTFLCLVYVSQLLKVLALWVGFPFPLLSEVWEWSKLLQVREAEQVGHTIIWHQALLRPCLRKKIHFWCGMWSVKPLSRRSLRETWQSWAAMGLRFATWSWDTQSAVKPPSWSGQGLALVLKTHCRYNTSSSMRRPGDQISIISFGGDIPIKSLAAAVLMGC